MPTFQSVITYKYTESSCTRVQVKYSISGDAIQIVRHIIHNTLLSRVTFTFDLSDTKSIPNQGALRSSCTLKFGDPGYNRFYRATLCVNAVFAVARCASVCPSVTVVYCIHVAEDIVKLL